MKNKKKGLNWWKIASLILGVLVVLLIVIDLQRRASLVDVDGLQIPKETLCKFYELGGENYAYQFCDTKEKICTRQIQFKQNPCE